MKPHKCQHCGHEWKSIDDKTAADVEKAANVNKQGPFCALCYHLQSAYDIAHARGSSLIVAATDWLIIKKSKK